jgi:predicted transcriptional regulator
MKAGEAITRPLVKVGPRDFARLAAGLMDDLGTTMLPVADDHVFLGVVTKASVSRGCGGVASPRVDQVMSQPILVATLETDVETLFDAMTVHEVLCVPVLDGRQVAGTVTRQDLLRAISHDDPHLHGVAERLEAGRAAQHS